MEYKMNGIGIILACHYNAHQRWISYVPCGRKLFCLRTQNVKVGSANATSVLSRHPFIE